MITTSSNISNTTMKLTNMVDVIWYLLEAQFRQSLLSECREEGQGGHYCRQIGSTDINLAEEV